MEIEKTMFIREIETMLDNKKQLRRIIQGSVQGLQTRYPQTFIEIQNLIDDVFRAAYALTCRAAPMIREWDKENEKDDLPEGK